MPGLTGEVANLIVSLKLDDSGFSRGIGNATARLKTLEAGGYRVGTGMKQVASGIGTLVTRGAIAATAGLTAVLTTAASYEQAFTGVEKTVEGTDAQLADLEATLRQMARTIPVSFEELAAIGETGGALGIARDSIDEFVDVVARLSVSTNLSADQAATALGTLGNVLHLSSADYETFSDSLVGLGNAGASTEAQIIELAQRFGAAGKQAGLSNEEILALASTTASMGIEAEAGGGALSRVFNGITTNIGTTSDEAKAMAKAMGMSLSDLRTAWDQDAGKVFEDLLGYIHDLDQFEAAAFLQDLGITNTRDINAITLLASGVEEYGRQLAVAEDSAGALDKESQKFFDTSAGQWKILVANVRDAAATIGSELLPVANDLMKEFVGELQKPGTQEGIKNFAKDLAKGIKDVIKELKGTDFSGLIGGMKLAAEVAKGAFDAFRSLPAPIQQLAIAALVANKVSGGAVGQIAKGLANIVLGGGQIGAGLLSRGSLANPMFVTVTNPGMGGGAGGAPTVLGGAGKSFLPKGVGGWLGLLGIAATDVVLIKTAVDTWNDQKRNVTAAADFERGVVDARTEQAKSIADLRKLRDEIAGNIDTGQGRGNIIDTVLGHFFVDPELQRQVAELDRRIAAAEAAQAAGKNPFAPTPASTAAQIREGESFDKALSKYAPTLEKLATNEVIQHLERTNEIGQEGIGSSFQTGIKDGLDPVGDVATRILARAENPKAPQVLFEVQQHLKGLEEIQAQYLAQGDVELAAKVQANIDTLHTLIGTVDTSNAILERQKAEAAGADVAMLNSVRRQTTLQQQGSSGIIAKVNEMRTATSRGFSESGTYLRSIDRKNWSPTVNVQATINVSTSALTQKIQRARIATGNNFREGLE